MVPSAEAGPIEPALGLGELVPEVSGRHGRVVGEPVRLDVPAVDLRQLGVLGGGEEAGRPHAVGDPVQGRGIAAGGHRLPRRRDHGRVAVVEGDRHDATASGAAVCDVADCVGPHGRRAVGPDAYRVDGCPVRGARRGGCGERQRDIDPFARPEPGGRVGALDDGPRPERGQPRRASVDRQAGELAEVVHADPQRQVAPGEVEGESRLLRGRPARDRHRLGAHHVDRRVVDVGDDAVRRPAMAGLKGGEPCGALGDGAGCGRGRRGRTGGDPGELGPFGGGECQPRVRVGGLVEGVRVGGRRPGVRQSGVVACRDSPRRGADVLGCGVSERVVGRVADRPAATRDGPQLDASARARRRVHRDRAAAIGDRMPTGAVLGKCHTMHNPRWSPFRNCVNQIRC